MDFLVLFINICFDLISERLKPLTITLCNLLIKETQTSNPNKEEVHVQSIANHGANNDNIKNIISLLKSFCWTRGLNGNAPVPTKLLKVELFQHILTNLTIFNDTDWIYSNSSTIEYVISLYDAIAHMGASFCKHNDQRHDFEEEFMRTMLHKVQAGNKNYSESAAGIIYGLARHDNLPFHLREEVIASLQEVTRNVKQSQTTDVQHGIACQAARI